MDTRLLPLIEKLKGTQTIEHQMRVANYAWLFFDMYKDMLFHDDYQTQPISFEDFQRALFYHDIGKTRDLAIYESDSPITFADKLMHVEHGKNIMSEIYGENHIFTQTAYLHHYKTDLSGYPKADEILINPIVYITAIFDTIDSKVNRSQIPVREAIESTVFYNNSIAPDNIKERIQQDLDWCIFKISTMEARSLDL